MSRFLIVNADDFGQSPGINAGIARAHEKGIVSSASLMVRWPSAGAAGAYAREHPSLSVGLHLDLCEWTCTNGEWVPLYEVVPLTDEAAVRSEVGRQFDLFEQIVGAVPTHVDSHQHVHKEPIVLTAVMKAASALGVPVRDLDARVRYDGRFYGQGHTARPNHDQISVAALLAIVETLSPGVTELSCHPAVGCDFESVYNSEREIELAVLCNPIVRDAIHAAGVRIVSFRDMTP